MAVAFRKAYKYNGYISTGIDALTRGTDPGEKQLFQLLCRRMGYKKQMIRNENTA